MRKDTWLFCSDIIFRVLEFGFYNVRRVVDGCYKKIVLSCHSGRCYVLVLSVLRSDCGTVISTTNSKYLHDVHVFSTTNDCTAPAGASDKYYYI